MNKFANANYIYSLEWDKSAKYSYKQGLYDWLSSDLKGYDYIIKFGCGTGYSTLSLLEKGHKVLAIDSNEYCISKAYELLINKKYKAKKATNIKDLYSLDYDVIFMCFDFEEDFSLLNFSFLCSYKVCCLHWNPCRNAEHEYCDIKQEIKDSNADIENQIDIIMSFSQKNNFDVQLVDRGNYAEFYHLLKEDYNYDKLDIKRNIFNYNNSGKKLSIYENMDIPTNMIGKTIEIVYIMGHFRNDK